MKQKRLGQFFSGEKVSNLLSSFTDIDKAKPISIIDPMCGICDMLIAASNMYSAVELRGIDIDEDVTKKVEEINSENGKAIEVITGSAFLEETINQLPRSNYDLVITNPPYVRYQSFSNKQDDYPSAIEVRQGLLNLMPLMSHLGKRDKEILTTLINNYSGLSDLAVPSWILCAMLTKIGGKLAMVVPESWLNREYADSIHYLLLKLFKIEYVIEDLDRSWFKNKAQVKTNLVIATRIPIVEDMWDFYENDYYHHIGLTSVYDDEKSLLGGLYPESRQPEVDFFQDFKNNNIKDIKGIEVKTIRIKNKLEQIFNESKKKSWFNQLEKENLYPTITAPFPVMMKEIIPAEHTEFTTLEDIGVGVGQGLRTGANKFFYVDYMKDEGVIKLDNEITAQTYNVPSDVLKIVIRKQSELPPNYYLDEKKLTGRLLFIKNYIHPSDFYETRHRISTRKIMPRGLSQLISKAEKVNLGSDYNPKFIPDYSAVKTNVRKIKDENLDTAHFWYMLPTLRNRHLPDVFVPRINSKSAKFYLNSDSKVVVDANFSGLWINDEEVLNKYALLAILNSDWIKLCCEMIGAVMGGGELKLEATHLKKIPIPRFSIEEIKMLTMIGKKLTLEEKELIRVNRIIAKNIFKEDFLNGGEEIQKLLQIKLEYREKG